MRPLWLAGGAALAGFLVLRRRRLGRPTLALGTLAALLVALIGLGVVPIPDVEAIVERVGSALGPWTYLFVGVLAFLETGAFVGLIVPGETTVLVGGLVAGQGQISLLLLIAIVWGAAVAGDLTSYALGRRLGREFLVRHGPRVKITQERLARVEAFFARHGGATILIGRFVGLVRALAPFVAGASRMPLRTFLPYDVLGAGLWASLFCVLGYVFWRSLDRVTQYVSQGLLVFGLVAVLGVAIVYARRLAHDARERARARAWAARQAARPALAPVVRALAPLWRRLGRPLAHLLARPARFLYERLTPGDLGLELTTLLALAAVGAFSFLGLAEALSERALLPLDRQALTLADALHVEGVERVLAVLTDLGAFPVVAVAVLATALWSAVHRRLVDAVTLVAGFALTWIAVRSAKAALDRPRPAEPHIATDSAAFPSGHAANAVAFVACAVVLVRAGHTLAGRLAAVGVAIAVVAAVGASRVYLRAHYPSDVLGGVAAAVAVFALLAALGVVVAFERHDEGERA